MKKIKRWRVYQTISIFVDAENGEEAKNKILSDESNCGWITMQEWNKWDVELDCIYKGEGEVENDNR